MSSAVSSSVTEAQGEKLAIEAKRAMAYLQAQRNYRYVEFLAQGDYGYVCLVYDEKGKRSLAIKCVVKTSELEMNVWPELRHDNILPLTEHISLDSCAIFIMPVMRKDLRTSKLIFTTDHTTFAHLILIVSVLNEGRCLWKLMVYQSGLGCVTDPHFYPDEFSFGKCRVWLKNVATALAYLHSQFLCHLDLKLENVFLKEDGSACLGDFSLLSDTREVPPGFHSFNPYEPPEYIPEWSRDTPSSTTFLPTEFSGDKADMWQFGLLAIDLLTNLKIPNSANSDLVLWNHDILPIVQKIVLHREYLDYLLEKTFQKVIFDSKDLERCHGFLGKILRVNPTTRVGSEFIAKHAFLDVEWPRVSSEFGVPKLASDHQSEPKAKKKKEKRSEEKLKDRKDSSEASDIESAIEVLNKKKQKVQDKKKERRQKRSAGAGKSLLNITENASGRLREKESQNKEDTLKRLKSILKKSTNGGRSSIKKLKVSWIDFFEEETSSNRKTSTQTSEKSKKSPDKKNIENKPKNPDVKTQEIKKRGSLNGKSSNSTNTGKQDENKATNPGNGKKKQDSSSKISEGSPNAASGQVENKASNSEAGKILNSKQPNSSNKAASSQRYKKSKPSKKESSSTNNNGKKDENKAENPGNEKEKQDSSIKESKDYPNATSGKDEIKAINSKAGKRQNNKQPDSLNNASSSQGDNTNKPSKKASFSKKKKNCKKDENKKNNSKNGKEKQDSSIKESKDYPNATSGKDEIKAINSKAGKRQNNKQPDSSNNAPSSKGNNTNKPAKKSSFSKRNNSKKKKPSSTSL